MCIAIYKPAGKVIEEDVLKTCATNNKDGCGFAYINTDHLGVKRIKVKKTMDFEIFIRQYKRACKNNPDSPFLIHFRIATHGEVSKFNCHPFVVDEDVVFVHNGMISDVAKDTRKSDTQMFNEEILKGLHPEDLVYNNTIKRLLEEFIGWNSKLIFMNIDGDIQICNEKKGNWEDGCWYSNTSWKPKVSKTVYPIAKSNSSWNYRNGYGYEYEEKEDTVFSYEPCDMCGGYKQINRMNAYRCLGDVVIFCPSCTPEGIERHNLTAFDSIRPYQYVEHINKDYQLIGAN